MTTTKLRLWRPEEFFSDPKPCTAMEDVARQLEQEETLLDLRQGEDWSYLSGRVVGAEGN